MALPRETQHAAGPWKLDGRDVHTAAPAPTSKPRFLPRNQLLGRQESASDTCGYYSFSRGDDGWEPWQCGGAPCRTIGSYFGCYSTLWTACYESADSYCTTGQLDDRELCCGSTEFPYCVTALKNHEDGDLTAYICGNDIASGEVIIYPSTSGTFVISTTQDGRVTTKVVESTISVTGTSGSNLVDSDNGEGTPSPSADDPDGDSKSDTPVGAIVGGVVGGIALIALVAFGLWFVRFQKRKAQAQARASNMPGTPSGHMSLQPYPPGYHPAPQASPPGEYYNPVTSKPGSPAPVAELPDQHSERPPVELQ